MNAIVDKIRIDARSAKPIYQQVTEHLQQLIGTEQIKAGEHLPSIRHLGSLLNVSPNTVAKAYLELERQQVVITKRGGGTIVASGMNGQVTKAVRQKHLFDSVNEDITKTLSKGYSPEELEAAFYTRLEWLREERRVLSTGAPAAHHSRIDNSHTLRIAGSHDIALNILVAMLRQRQKEVVIELTHSGSLRALITLEEEKADLSGIHLLDEETSDYNFPFIKRILPGREMMVVNLAHRIQGLMLPPGNPMKIMGVADLQRQNIVFANRQKGSGTRVLLDIQLKRMGISPQAITGYNVELHNHLMVGSAVAQGKADAGLGIEAAAHSCGLDFLPLFRERYDLVIPGHVYRSEILAPLLRIITSDEFKRIVNEVDGYDTSQTGTTTFMA